MSRKIKLIYLDNLDVNKREHLGLTEDFRLIRIYGDIDIEESTIVDLEGDYYADSDCAVLYNVTNHIVYNKAKFEVDNNENIDYIDKALNFFYQQGLKNDFLRVRVLALLPTFLADKDCEKYESLIKQYLHQLNYCI